jgi:hypothetical protein
MQNFTYNALDSSLSQIRLVCLLPLGDTPEHVSGTVQLQCSIQTVCFRDKLRYAALSYTWGDPSRTSRLIISEDSKETNGNSVSELPITKSVENALLHLRHSTSKITL